MKEQVVRFLHVFLFLILLASQVSHFETPANVTDNRWDPDTQSDNICALRAQCALGKWHLLGKHLSGPVTEGLKHKAYSNKLGCAQCQFQPL